MRNKAFGGLGIALVLACGLVVGGDQGEGELVTKVCFSYHKITDDSGKWIGVAETLEGSGGRVDYMFSFDDNDIIVGYKAVTRSLGEVAEGGEVEIAGSLILALYNSGRGDWQEWAGKLVTENISKRRLFIRQEYTGDCDVNTVNWPTSGGVCQQVNELKEKGWQE